MPVQEENVSDDQVNTDQSNIFVQEENVNDDQVNTAQSNIFVQDNLIFDNEIEQTQCSLHDPTNMLNFNFLNSINDDRIEYKHGMAIMVDSSILTIKNFNGIISSIGNSIEQQSIGTTAFVKSSMLFFAQQPNNEFRLFKQMSLSQGSLYLSVAPQIISKHFQSILPFLSITDTVVSEKNHDSSNILQSYRHSVTRLTSNELIHYCAQMSSAGRNIPFDAMTQDQLLFYCDNVGKDLHPNNCFEINLVFFVR